MPSLDENGFQPERLQDIKDGMEADLKGFLGGSINLDSRSTLGQIVGIIANLVATAWEGLEAVYNSFSTATASGVSLDRLVALNGIGRLGQTKGTVVVRAYGVLGTPVLAGFVASVAGVATSRWNNTVDAEVDTTTSEAQHIDFSPSAPSSGNWKITFSGQETSSLAHNIDAATLQTALRALSNIGSGNILVTGDMTDGFDLVFAAALADLKWPMVTISANTLSPSAVVTVTEVDRGGSYAELDCLCESFGSIAAPAQSITVIETPVVDITETWNPLAASMGRVTETDSELRARRATILKRQGTATVEGIRNLLLNSVPNVTVALVVENQSGVTDGEGRPGHSFECIVEGGDEQAIADAIWSAKPAGIETFGDISMTVVDSQGLSHTVKFSRPTGVPIYLIIDIVGNADAGEGPVYPADGDAKIKAALVAFGEANYGRGGDVIINALYTPINTVPGVFGITIKAGLAPSPTLSDNIPIAFNQVAQITTGNITVNS